jgi:hypothetical protein
LLDDEFTEDEKWLILQAWWLLVSNVELVTWAICIAAPDDSDGISNDIVHLIQGTSLLGPITVSPAKGEPGFHCATLLGTEYSLLSTPIGQEVEDALGTTLYGGSRPIFGWGGVAPPDPGSRAV